MSMTTKEKVLKIIEQRNLPWRYKHNNAYSNVAKLNEEFTIYYQKSNVAGQIEIRDKVGVIWSDLVYDDEIVRINKRINESRLRKDGLDNTLDTLLRGLD